MTTRKDKLEKALAYDDTLRDISAHPKAFRQGRAAEMFRLAPLHEALVAAIENLEDIQACCRDRSSSNPLVYAVCLSNSTEALSKIDKVLGDVK